MIAARTVGSTLAMFAALLLTGLLLLTPQPARAQALGFHYCWAPDPATDTVHVSPIRPTGPIAERAGYGPRFAAELKARGVTGVILQAHCNMRSTLAELQRAKAALPRETCMSCQGASRFVEVPWSTDAIIPPPPPRAIAGRSTKSAPPENAVQPPLPAQPGPAGPVVVVLGNSETGAVVARFNKPDLLALVRDEAFGQRETGWRTLLVSDQPGLGLVLCEEANGVFRHHVTHGHENFAEARAAVMAAAGQDPDGTPIRPCKAWRAFPGQEPFVDDDWSLIDTVKGLIRREVTKDSCPKKCAKGTFRTRFACMCVRG